MPTLGWHPMFLANLQNINIVLVSSAPENVKINLIISCHYNLPVLCFVKLAIIYNYHVLLAKWTINFDILRQKALLPFKWMLFGSEVQTFVVCSKVSPQAEWCAPVYWRGTSAFSHLSFNHVCLKPNWKNNRASIYLMQISA